jgi:hypothetical protein
MARHYDLMVIQEDSKRRQRADSVGSPNADSVTDRRVSASVRGVHQSASMLRQRAIEFFTGLPTQRLQVRALRVGHRFIASFPFVRVALQRWLSGIIR